MLFCVYSRSPRRQQPVTVPRGEARGQPPLMAGENGGGGRAGGGVGKLRVGGDAAVGAEAVPDLSCVWIKTEKNVIHESERKREREREILPGYTSPAICKG